MVPSENPRLPAKGKSKRRPTSNAQRSAQLVAPQRRRETGDRIFERTSSQSRVDTHARSLGAFDAGFRGGRIG